MDASDYQILGSDVDGKFREDGKSYAKHSFEIDQKKMSTKMEKLNRRMELLGLSENHRRLSDGIGRPKLETVKEETSTKARRVSDSVGPGKKSVTKPYRVTGGENMKHSNSFPSLSNGKTSKVKVKKVDTSLKGKEEHRAKSSGRVRKRPSIEVPRFDNLHVSPEIVIGQDRSDTPELSLVDKGELVRKELECMDDIRKKLSSFMGHSAYEEKERESQRKFSAPVYRDNTLAVNYNKGRRMSLEAKDDHLDAWIGDRSPVRKLSPAPGSPYSASHAARRGSVPDKL